MKFLTVHPQEVSRSQLLRPVVTVPYRDLITTDCPMHIYIYTRNMSIAVVLCLHRSFGIQTAALGVTKDQTCKVCMVSIFGIVIMVLGRYLLLEYLDP